MRKWPNKCPKSVLYHYLPFWLTLIAIASLLSMVPVLQRFKPLWDYSWVKLYTCLSLCINLGLKVEFPQELPPNAYYSYQYRNRNLMWRLTYIACCWSKGQICIDMWATPMLCNAPLHVVGGAFFPLLQPTKIITCSYVNMPVKFGLIF